MKWGIVGTTYLQRDEHADRPEEVAGQESYLFADEAAYLSGQVIAIDGATT